MGRCRHSLITLALQMMKKFLPLLNRPACNGPFLPKFWTALATVIVGIFFRKKFWWVFIPIPVAYQKEFRISWKKRRFQIFQKPSSPGYQSFLIKQIMPDWTLAAWTSTWSTFSRRIPRQNTCICEHFPASDDCVPAWETQHVCVTTQEVINANSRI